MSRLGRRIERLEGDATAAGGTDILAVVPHAWSQEKQSAEVRRVALAHGAVEPFGTVVLVQTFGAAEEDSGQILFIGRLETDPYLAQPLTWRAA